MHTGLRVKLFGSKGFRVGYINQKSFHNHLTGMTSSRALDIHNSVGLEVALVRKYTDYKEWSTGQYESFLRWYELNINNIPKY